MTVWDASGGDLTGFDRLTIGAAGALIALATGIAVFGFGSDFVVSAAYGAEAAMPALATAAACGLCALYIGMLLPVRGRASATLIMLSLWMGHSAVTRGVPAIMGQSAGTQSSVVFTVTYVSTSRNCAQLVEASHPQFMTRKFCRDPKSERYRSGEKVLIAGNFSYWGVAYTTFRKTNGVLSTRPA